jgi:hypothetical protein
MYGNSASQNLLTVAELEVLAVTPLLGEFPILGESTHGTPATGVLPVVGKPGASFGEQSQNPQQHDI